MRYFILFLICLSPLRSALAIEAQNNIALSLTAEERQYLQAKQQLKMCVDPDWMPFEKTEKNQHVGMSADFMHLFAKKIGITITLQASDSWLDSLAMGKKRQCDFFSLIMSTPQREAFLDFSEPYIGFPLVLASRYEQIFIGDIENILDKKLGIQKGYAYAEILRLRYPNINLLEVVSLQDGLDKVSHKQLFAMIGSLPSIAFILQHHYIGELKISGKLDQIWQLGIGARNDEPLLVSIFNKAIASVSLEERKAITNRWLATEYELATDYTLLIQILLGLAVLFVFFLYHHLQLRQYNILLQQLSTTDALTNVGNRAKLDEVLNKMLLLAKRYQQSFSIMLVDVDHFKEINDQYGHLVGDVVLQDIAQLLEENIRTVDTIGRWGGEEFLIICPEQTAESSHLLAEKLRILITEYPFAHIDKLSCSFGISSYQTNDSSHQLIKRADIALYQAKKQGRNCVVLAETE
jgi:diguanylate cyclase (GGDEF)-like protein